MNMNYYELPSGKRLHNYGKSHFYSWVNQLFLWAMFNSYVELPEVISIYSIYIFHIYIYIPYIPCIPCIPYIAYPYMLSHSYPYFPYGGFQKWGYPPVIIHFSRNFHEINDPAIGDLPFMETLR